MTCTYAADAPWNDLNDLLLIQKLLCHEKVNQQISNNALRAFKRHLWYLTEEMVLLALVLKCLMKYGDH